MHVSAASQALNLNSPCLPESKVALFSDFHLKINSVLQTHLQGNVYAHARRIVQTLQVKAKMSANGATRLGGCCCVGVGVVIVIIHIIIIISSIIIIIIIIMFRFHSL